MRVDKEKFKETFPRLYEEISNDEGTISIKGVRHVDPDTIIDELSNPDVISFIRRARTEEEALEIINFCEHRGEIDSNYANKLRKQLKEKGLRSFGPYKPPGYYFK
ncbi:MAG: DUF2095 family protein, partial [Candidatus Odinarchaeota archaeon]|nr:DUF2095 family protein [Candidatus Odinarchaeota archaeon]